MDDTVSLLSANTTARIPTPLKMTRKLKGVYQINAADYQPRFEKVKKRFKDYFADADIQFIVRVPGVMKIPLDQSDLKMLDYGLGCMEQDVLVAIGKNEKSLNNIQIGNTEKAKYPVVWLFLT